MLCFAKVLDMIEGFVPHITSKILSLAKFCKARYEFSAALKE